MKNFLPSIEPDLLIAAAVVGAGMLLMAIGVLCYDAWKRNPRRRHRR